MGIGNTVKEMFKNETSSVDDGDSTGARRSISRPEDTASRTTNRRTLDSDALNESTKTTKLPSGTGIGTSGKPSHESEMEHDLARSRSQGIAGYGTDAAAASGGSLIGTHQGARTTGLSNEHNIHVGPTVVTSVGSPSGQPMGGSRIDNTRSSGLPSTTQSRYAASGHTGVLHPQHGLGHAKRDVMPSGDANETTTQLHPVTHEHIRHLETEDVERVKEHERHIHHVQHHTQPVITSQQLPEKHREQVHPVTRIEEQHVNKVEDNTLLQSQVHQHRDATEHGAKEKTIVDKGMAVTERVHHHIHHVIQPVIEKTTVDRQFTHTKIPIYEVTNEAPIVHQSQTHAPIPLERFVDQGGVLNSGTSQNEIAKKVLQGGECTREVDGIATELERDLNLDPQQTRVEEHPQYINTKVIKRTTTVDEPTVAPTPRN